MTFFGEPDPDADGIHSQTDHNQRMDLSDVL
jgi:hypothetical protein